ncbi:MAG: hypothetical protein IJR94_05220, partial [Synergistaceae bacterium]|nr:hypothetical protein [Synergistaceae bacterium]
MTCKKNFPSVGGIFFFRTNKYIGIPSLALIPLGGLKLIELSDVIFECYFVILWRGFNVLRLNHFF